MFVTTEELQWDQYESLILKRLARIRIRSNNWSSQKQRYIVDSYKMQDGNILMLRGKRRQAMQIQLSYPE